MLPYSTTAFRHLSHFFPSFSFLSVLLFLHPHNPHKHLRARRVTP